MRGKRKKRGIAEESKTLIAMVNASLDETHPQTLRQLHYVIFSTSLKWYGNTAKSQKKLSRVLTRARRLYRQWELYYKNWSDTTEKQFRLHQMSVLTSGLEIYNPQLIPLVESGELTWTDAFATPPALGVRPDYMVDELRRGESPATWENKDAYLEQTKNDYRRNLWQDQPNHVEVWGEKATVLGSLRPIALGWGVTIRVCRGFASVGMEDEIGRLFEGITKPITIFYVGDHDASGDLIGREFHKRVETAAGVKFKMVRLAILPEDIRKFKLPPQKIKDADRNAPAFRKKFGKNAPTVEIEALPAGELTRRIETAVMGMIDFDRWTQQSSTEDVELESISFGIDAFKKAKGEKPK